ncbi:replicative DNA helicase [Patescibacteria group bacterium]
MADKKISVRIPPHSTEAEESVLGALVLDKDAIIAVAEFLTPEDFYDERHKEIFQACLDLYEDRVPVDVLTVAEKLKKRKSLKKVGGAAYLAGLVNKVPTAAHVEHYGRIVKDAATKRSLMAAASKLLDLSSDEGLAADELLDKAESEVFALTQRHLTRAFTAVKEALAESFDRLDELHKQGEGLRGVSTGFKSLDDALAGLQKSNLLILAARPGVGKTSLALSIAQNVAVKLKRPVGFFSLEMSKEELVDRLLVSQADIDAWKLKTGKLDEEDFTKLSNAMGELAEAPLFIDDTPALSIIEMRTKARRLQVESGVDLVIVDYLQLARSRQLENRVQEVSEISQGLKNLAREIKVPVLAISQLSRAVEQRGVKKPQLADLRESGCLLGNTKILDADSGKMVEIKTLVGKSRFRTLALDGDLKLVKTKVSRVFPSGRKMVYKLVLKSGREIKASGNHPFYKLCGWERLDNLQIGDRVAVPRLTNSNPKNVAIPNTHLSNMIPEEIWHYIDTLAVKNNITEEEFNKKTGRVNDRAKKFKCDIRRERLKKIAIELDDKYLLNLSTSDIYWDEVKEIEKIGIKKVYDATVPKYANFIANDIIVHNSIEQDSDVVMFLWREDEENSENIMLEIAKHRNGPLASVPLYFKGDRIKFFERETKRK